jgi:hypothetical protein
MKFRKKPVVIEAIQFTGSNFEEVISFGNGKVLHNVTLGGDENGNGHPQGYDKIFIPTLEVEMNVSVNDWIIKGVQGEFYPCKPDIFEKTYELAEAD